MSTTVQSPAADELRAAQKQYLYPCVATYYREPLVITEASGFTVVDAEGRKAKRILRIDFTRYPVDEFGVLSEPDEYRRISDGHTAEIMGKIIGDLLGEERRVVVNRPNSFAAKKYKWTPTKDEESALRNACLSP